MIAKKITNPRKVSTKRTRIAKLLSYIYAPERPDTTEKCAYAGARGFLTDSTAGRIAEMTALAEDAVRSPDPIVHYVLSWRAGEHPTAAQVEEAVDILLEELAVPTHQAAYALHTDTAHDHLHVVLNRVHPDTLRPVQINRGFDVDAVQRAAARIEHAQSWEIETNKRWRIGANGRPVPSDANPAAPDRPRPKRARTPSQRQRDMSRRTGIPSVTQRAIETLAPVIAAARSWPELHTALRKRGAQYHRKGGGAAIVYDGVTVKASAVARDASVRALETRFGEPYQARDAERTPRAAPQDAAAPIAAAASWAELHAALAARGLRYERKGSGARVRSATHDVKASEVARGASLAQLERRLGPFVPATAEEAGRDPDPGPDRTMPTGPDVAARRAEPAPGPELPDPAAAAPPIATARSWIELHAALATAGCHYTRKGSGATVTAGIATGTPVTAKASEVARNATLSALERRLGPWQPGPDPVAPAIPAPATAEPDAAPETGPAASAPAGADPDDWQRYRRDRHEYRDRKARRRIRIDQAYDRDLARLRERHRGERRSLHQDPDGQRRDWTDRGDELNGQRSLLAALHAAALATLADRRRRAHATRRRLLPPWPEYADWRRDRDRPTGEQRWPWAHHQELAPAAPAPPDTPPGPPADIRSYRGEVGQGGHVAYRHIRTRERHFTDIGRAVRVHAGDRDQAVLASLQLAAARFGAVRITGSRAFRARSVRVALAHGTPISPHGIEDLIAAERRQQKRRAEIERLADRYAAVAAGSPLGRAALRTGPDGELTLWWISADHSGPVGPVADVAMAVDAVRESGVDPTTPRATLVARLQADVAAAHSAGRGPGGPHRGPER